MMNKEKFLKLKEIVLYILGVSLFINFNITKISLGFIFVFILIDIFYFKEKMEFGNKKLRKLVLFFIGVGILWNFLADFNYRAVRAFLKINQYFIITFYLYSLVKEKKEILRKFIISIGIGYLLLFFNGINTYFLKKDISRFEGYLGIMSTALISSIITVFSFGGILESKSKKIKIFSIFLCASSLFLLVISQTRAALLAVILSCFILVVINKNIKLLLLSCISGMVLLLIFFQTPYSNRFKKNTFNVERTVQNTSNGLRVEMWKNAIWRYSQHPITGTGTKQDKKLFDKYVDMMPEDTKVQRYYKSIFEKGFDDAHSMYLNNLVYHGVFSIFQFLIFLPYFLIVLIKNLEFKYRLATFGALISYCIYGVVWPLWRGGADPVFLWVILAITGCSCLKNKGE